MNVPLASLTIICFLLTLVFRCLIYFYALMGNEKKKFDQQFMRLHNYKFSTVCFMKIFS
jgi:hypothetical protein